jgi:1-acyl-sn-glycerol-3-phosphate acyltransferase
VIAARRSPLALRFFDTYVPRYLGRRFHRLWLRGPDDMVPRPRGIPVIYAMSHAAWWDVLVGYHLARHVVRLPSYAPMDEAQLRRYRILSRIGLYSVDRFSRRGAREFLAYTEHRLREPAAVWLTPQGELVSARRRPVRFQTGLGHLVRRLPRITVVPVAIVYEFIEEPRPEIFVSFGAPQEFQRPSEDAAALTEGLAAALEHELDRVEAALLARDFSGFTVLLAGATSTSAVYDLVRRARARITGQADPARHGDVVSDPRREPRR